MERLKNGLFWSFLSLTVVFIFGILFSILIYIMENVKDYLLSFGYSEGIAEVFAIFTAISFCMGVAGFVVGLLQDD